MNNFTIMYDKTSSVFNQIKPSIDNFNVKKKKIVCRVWGNISNKNKLLNVLKNKGEHVGRLSQEELFVELYKLMGISFLKLIHGRFACCIIDVVNNMCLVFKSYMSEIQFYYKNDDRGFMLSNSLTTILERSDNKIDNFAVQLYINLRYIPAPYTIIQNIYKLEPGQLLFYNSSSIEIQYVSSDAKQRNINVKECITNSICELYNSKNSPGILLSGGLDSSVITSIISKNFKNNTLKAFTVGYNTECNCDETKIAKKIANDLNVEQDILIIKENELQNLINETIDILEEPFYSTVSISTLKLAKVVSYHTKYVFSGDGSDELFYGYEYLRESLNAKDTVKKYISGVSWLKGIACAEIVKNPIVQYDDVCKMLFKSIDEDANAKILRDVEVFNRFPNYHLFRIGKIFNIYGVNSLLPFASNEVIKCSLALNSDQVLDNDDPKSYLKNILREYLTKDMKFLKKRPFTAPHKEWMEGVLHDDIVSVFNNKLLFDILDIKQSTCLKILNNYSGDYKDVSNLWGIYMLLKWCERFEKFIKREGKNEKG